MEKLTRQEVIKKLVENDIQIIKENIEEGNTQMLEHILTKGCSGYVDMNSEDLLTEHYNRFEVQICITD